MVTTLIQEEDREREGGRNDELNACTRKRGKRRMGPNAIRRRLPSRHGVRVWVRRLLHEMVLRPFPLCFVDPSPNHRCEFVFPPSFGE